MAYIVPTPADVRARFPEFTTEEVSDPQIASFIAFAKDQGAPDALRWSERDYKMAIIALTAHFMAMWQQQVLADLNSGGGAGGGSSSGDIETFMSKVEFGDEKVSYGTGKSTNVSVNNGGGGGSSLAVDPVLLSSRYGELYAFLLRRNIIPMAVL